MKKYITVILLLASNSFAASINCEMKRSMPDFYKAQLYGPNQTAGQTTYTLNVIYMYYGYIDPQSYIVKPTANGFKGADATVMITKKDKNKIKEITVTTTKKHKLNALEMICE